MNTTDRPAAIRPGEEIDAGSVAAFLRESIPGLAGEITIAQFPSGFSNLTYQIRVGDREMVLRRPPIGANVAAGHDMGREYRVLKALHPVFPLCPEPLAYTEDTSVIGAPFFVMEKMSGIILRKDLPPGLFMAPGQARALCRNLVDVLVDIHTIDVAGSSLDFIGRPQGYVRRQVEGWSGRYRKARTEDAPDFEAVMAWLDDRMPPDTPSPGIVHNDYKFDNVVLDPHHPDTIMGVLDWEMATFGDPLMDLGNSLAYWVDRTDPQEMELIRTMPTTMDGAMTRSELLDYYALKTGRDVRNFDFYYCFGLFRLAVIAQQIYHRYFNGLTRDKRFAKLIFAVKILETSARRIMDTSRE